MVFMITKHDFPGDEGLLYSQTSAPEPSKPPPPPPPSECPRCGSINTKFCYYNNYNKLQPRHFCKSCKRHWTKGGALRNIPAGRRRSTNKRRPRTPTAENNTDQKNIMSNILYQALAQSSSPSASASTVFQFESTILESSGTTHTAASYSDSAPQTHNHPNSSFTSFISRQQSPSNDYNMYKFAQNLDSAEESTVTTSAAPPWTAAAADSWSWSDVLGSSADLNTVWDYLTLL